MAKSVVTMRAKAVAVVRCAYCHDSDDESSLVTCAGCNTLLHAECTTGRCPTIGCKPGASDVSGLVVTAVMIAAVASIIAVAWAVWVLTGLIPSISADERVTLWFILSVLPPTLVFIDFTREPTALEQLYVQGCQCRGCRRGAK